MTPGLRIAMGVFLIVHGIAHLVGFVVPWQLMKAPDLPYRTTIFGGAIDVGAVGIKIVGVLWLILAIAVAGLGTSYLANRLSYPAALGIVGASLLMSIAGWPDARIGVAINAVLLVALKVLGS
ncbi:MAG: hypothetical protein ND807_17845 [Vicinamibacterales bacterium]|nr:hypothetical protein [Vicinamibacterales bacterium]